MGLEAIAIVGPTASGKTRRGVDVARCFNGEIISGDSRQVYRGMTIGTGKDLCEYEDIPYHLIDIADAGSKYNLHQYLRDFRKSFSEIKSRGKLPVIVGGSGMYVENALNGVYLPEVGCNAELRESLKGKSLEELTDILKQYKTLHNTTDVDTCQRAIRAIEIEEYYRNNPQEALQSRKETTIPINALVIGIDVSRELRRDRISRRLRSRLDEGMVEEVKGLLDSGIAPEDLIYYGLEYKFLTLYITGELSYDEMVGKLEIAIHQFAKRQMTWWRGMEKRGWKINWLSSEMPKDDFLEECIKLVNHF